jgi:hypothetical protein
MNDVTTQDVEVSSDGEASIQSQHSAATSLDWRQHTPASTIAYITNDVGNMRIEPRTSQISHSPAGSQLHANSLSPDRNTPGGANRPYSSSRRRSSSHVERAQHRVEEEVPPHDEFHDSAFQQKFTGVKRVVADLANILENSPLRNEAESAIAGLHLRARDLGSFQCPSTRTVGLVGDSGVGEYFSI